MPLLRRMQLLGRTIADTFRLRRYLGSGAAGDVYEAELLRDWSGLERGSLLAFKHYKTGCSRSMPRLRRSSAAEIRQLMLQLCSAVVALHSRGKIHRDIKPDNIMALDGPTLKLWISAS